MDKMLLVDNSMTWCHVLDFMLKTRAGKIRMMRVHDWPEIAKQSSTDNTLTSAAGKMTTEGLEHGLFIRGYICR
jgi:hypothetical protein